MRRRRRRGGERGEPALLASCHRRSLDVAAALGCRTVAFPAISTGIYGYPIELAAGIAVASTRAALADLPGIELVRFVLFGEEAEAAFAGAVTGA